ncbi:MAG: alpha/beta hydrolase family protein [Roseiflexaceae bacterium]
MTISSSEYSTVSSLLARFDQESRGMRLRAQNATELAAWQNELRTRLRAIIGLDSFCACPLDPQIDTPEQCDGYVQTRVVIAVEPDVRMPLYVLTPDDLRPGQRRPVMLAPHGHGSAGKAAVVGRADAPELARTIVQHNYAYGVQLVRAGYIVLCPDARGFGERREPVMLVDGDLLGSSCRVLNNMAIPLGQTVTGMWTWDLMRLLDYVATRADCDATRIGCAGLSGGGAQTLWLAALDDRVRCAVVSGYFYGYKDALLRLSTNCSCNYVPGLWQLADMGDIGALLAPRPLLIETGRQDDLNGERGVANVTEQLDITRQAYALLGTEDRLAHTVFEGGHRWDGTAVLPWLARWLMSP